ncbi:Brp/Blh family beta-carotene 15,15'-monooxygenase [Flavobacterium sp. CG_9.1]|uniref:Brp/Blh family beta-carotene 15,15'-dioxygenase n=1 Tax=Flavobacterium sp. CG_9.1 TaxID=2787728 RepID=UPI0018CA2AC8|nr:Brp/Blh family beta-carotene 15,15'-dioxygenase [Flavobacterium sp. CG_9.1]MBG6062152.1 Brp/Blh family beta-carotene 15,15'-monooxygenase [Flavobacterium sp. CG_9.1]
MKNYSNIAIVASFFGLWMDSFLSTKMQILSGFLLIFTFGILHGANDLLLIKNTNTIKQTNSRFKILAYYVMVVLAGIFLFYIIPQVALLLFIIVSANHFGEQQWQNLEHDFPTWLLLLFHFFYGFVILLLLFNFHTIQVQNIIFKIANVLVPLPYFWIALQVSVGAFLGLSAYFYWKSEKIRKKLLVEFFFLLLFAILFKSSSLIWGFAIYFVLWHSIPSIIDQIKFLNGSFSTTYFVAYCRAAGVYWLISIVGIALIYFIFREEQLFNALFFSFLAAITFPHAVVITRMFGTKQTTK